ncbi:MAG: glycosyltransferase [Candidatus Omnitrophota bacterium]|nr:glycosyltransferase [Candidatus Omnitrophota bacterium]
MKILLVAPFSKDTVLGVIGNYCKNALINLGFNPQVFDFRESKCFRNTLGGFFKKTIKKVYKFSRQQISFVNSLEKKTMNRALLEEVRQFKPDIMLVLMGDNISATTLEEIKRQGIITANWFTDTVIDPRGERMSFVQQIAPHYDYFFIYDSEEVLKNIKIDAPCVRSIPLACDPSIHKSLNLTQKERGYYASEVCFIGSLVSSLDARRIEILRHLREFDLGIWGNWKEKDPLLYRFYKKKHVYLQEATKIYNSSDIALDIHIFFGTDKKAFDINPRVFEATACGAFVLTNESSYLANLYEIDKEIVCYSDVQELKQKIKYYLNHPQDRKAIAKQGQKRAHAEHTYEKRLGKILSIIETKG